MNLIIDKRCFKGCVLTIFPYFGGITARFRAKQEAIMADFIKSNDDLGTTGTGAVNMSRGIDTTS